MPKPILKNLSAQERAGNILSTTPNQDQGRKAQQMDKMKMDRLLRKKRSREYMDAIHKLDAGGHVHNQRQVDEILEVVRNEFPEIELGGVLLGIVSQCYLGKPYEVHTLDVSGQIIRHYEAGRPLPGGLEKARGIALRGGYDFIEVYADCCRCISYTGDVAVVPG